MGVVREPIPTFVRSQNFQSILFWDRFSWNRFSPAQLQPQPVAAETEPEPETEAAAASDPQYTTIEIFLKVVFFVIFILILMHPITLAVVNLWRLEVQCTRYDALYPYGPLGQFECPYGPLGKLPAAADAWGTLQGGESPMPSCLPWI